MPLEGINPNLKLCNSLDQMNNTISLKSSSLDETILDLVKAPLENIKELYKKPFRLDEKSIRKLNKLMFNLHRVKQIAKKKLPENVKEIRKGVNSSLQQILSVLFYDPIKPLTEQKANRLAFETIVNLLQKEADEEVVGQERPTGSVTKLIKRTFSKSNPKKGLKIYPEDISTINKIAAKLYPIALLTVQYDEKTKIPNPDQQKDLATHDAEQFVREYKAQFETDCGKIWTQDTFAALLNEVWDEKRGTTENSNPIDL